MQRLNRTIFALGIVWEVCRFGLLFLCVLSIFLQTFRAYEYGILWLVALVSPQLPIIACCLFLAVDSQRYSSCLNVLRMAKVVGLFAVCILIAMSIRHGGLDVLTLSVLGVRLVGERVAIVVAFFDLIFLLCLLLYGVNPVVPVETEIRENLPEFDETELDSPRRD